MSARILGRSGRPSRPSELECRAGLTTIIQPLLRRTRIGMVGEVGVEPTESPRSERGAFACLTTRPMVEAGGLEPPRGMPRLQRGAVAAGPRLHCWCSRWESSRFWRGRNLAEANLVEPTRAPALNRRPLPGLGYASMVRRVGLEPTLTQGLSLRPLPLGLPAVAGRRGRTRTGMSEGLSFACLPVASRADWRRRRELNPQRCHPRRFSKPLDVPMSTPPYTHVWRDSGIGTS